MVKDLTNPKAGFVSIVSGFENDYNVIDNFGSQLIVLTNHKAPNFEVIGIDVNAPEEKNWKRLASQPPIGHPLVVG